MNALTDISKNVNLQMSQDRVVRLKMESFVNLHGLILVPWSGKWDPVVPYILEAYT